MQPLGFIPTPEAIPAPVWLLTVLELLTFTLHILVINIVLGGSLLLLVSRFTAKNDRPDASFHGPAAKAIPTLFAIGINLGVAPLLFLQVTYGHLFYTSSVLMAVYWIMVIPLLILAYYGAYIHIRKYDSAALFSKLALFISTLFVLYIGFMLVNNVTLMEQPAKWTSYFANRGGTILNFSDATLIPRYLHFVTASIAIAGLFLSIVWSFKQPDDAAAKITRGLKIFGIATAVQLAIGFWFLLALPKEIIPQFMGQNMPATLILFAGILLGIGSIITAFLNKLWLTVGHAVGTVVLMVITRHMLRGIYLADHFRTESLELVPQYGILALFLIIFVVGLGVVAYMLHMALTAGKKEVVA